MPRASLGQKSKKEKGKPAAGDAKRSRHGG